MKRSTLTEREIQIVNLCASIAAGCQPCTKYHVNKCLDFGIPQGDIYSAIKKTEQICNKALKVMTSRAISALHISNEGNLVLQSEFDQREDILIGIVVSYTLNNTTLVEEFRNVSENLDLENEEIAEIIEISKFIYDKAKAHVEILSEEGGVEVRNNQGNDCSSGCGC